MKNIFALQCFMEGSKGQAEGKKPFMNSLGEAVGTHSKNTIINGLSPSGEETLNGKELSHFLSPSEETFVCLTLAKYLFQLLENDDEVKTLFYVEDADKRKIPPLTPFKHKHNLCYTDNDLAFFFRHVEYVHRIYREDTSKQRKDRWLYFEFSNDNSASEEGTQAGSQAAQDLDERAQNNNDDIDKELSGLGNFGFEYDDYPE